MRIIGISGLWCDGNPIWISLRAAYLRRFPGAEFVVEELSMLRLYHVRRLFAFVENIVAKHDAKGDVLLVGHSLGGVIACAVAQRMKFAKVLGVVTIFSPHSFPFAIYPRVLNVTHKLTTPILSFRAKRDRAVWWGAKHPHAIEHVVLDSDHLRTFNGKHAEEIARISAQHFLPVRNG